MPFHTLSARPVAPISFIRSLFSQQAKKLMGGRFYHSTPPRAFNTLEKILIVWGLFISSGIFAGAILGAISGLTVSFKNSDASLVSKGMERMAHVAEQMKKGIWIGSANGALLFAPFFVGVLQGCQQSEDSLV